MGNVINIYKYFSIKENLNLEVMLLVEKKIEIGRSDFTKDW